MPGFVRSCFQWGLLGLLVWLGAASHAAAADAIKVGFSMALTGPVASGGRQILQALEIWRDDVNAAGGLLGRPVELIWYDDQSNPANVPAIYTKLIAVDKADLLIGPYATNMIAPALPVFMQHNKTTIGILGLAANSEFHYPRYFSMQPQDAAGFSRGFFELAMAQNPKPRTLAITAADAEFARNASDAAREIAKRIGLEIVYDRRYPPNTTEYIPIVRAIQATNPDILFVAAYPPDAVGIVRAVHEVGLTTKLFGGAMVGLNATGIRAQLGPLLNGIVNNGVFVPSPGFDFPGVTDLLKKYQAKAPGLGLDPLGYSFVPFAYAAGQTLAAAVQATKSLDHDQLAAYIRDHEIQTVVGNVTFGKDGEWAKPRMVFTQFQNVTGNAAEQFRDGSKEVILWPEALRTGNIVYPYSDAKKK
jgi:branched-chain amino acid transport system substrate-binding protein